MFRQIRRWWWELHHVQTRAWCHQSITERTDGSHSIKESYTCLIYVDGELKGEATSRRPSVAKALARSYAGLDGAADAEREPSDERA